VELGPLQTKWVEALESGEYPQGRLCLKSADGYCCLGVANEVMGIKSHKDEMDDIFYYGEDSVYPNSTYKQIGLKDGFGSFGETCLASQNDNGKSFKEIAELIRKHKDEIFVESK